MVFLVPEEVRSKKRMLTFLTLTIIMIGVVRFVMTAAFALTFEQVRKNIPLRFDSLLLGVLVAVLKLHIPALYRKIAKTRIVIRSIIALMIVGGMYSYLYLTDSINNSVIFTSLSFFAISFFTAGMIPYLDANTKLEAFFMKNSKFTKIVTTLSLISYPLYLTHLPIFILIMKRCPVGIPPIFQFVLASMTAIAVAYGIYRYFEAPVMKIRERYFSSK
jgi:peptidoglycan/LPS O-acetylase OafA/YrhL